MKKIIFELRIAAFNPCNTGILTSTVSYTRPACPRQSAVRSSTEFIAIPPQARVNLSMFRRLALRKATMPSFANKSSERGSIP